MHCLFVGRAQMKKKIFRISIIPKEKWREH